MLVTYADIEEAMVVFLDNVYKVHTIYPVLVQTYRDSGTDGSNDPENGVIIRVDNSSPNEESNNLIRYVSISVLIYGTRDSASKLSEVTTTYMQAMDTYRAMRLYGAMAITTISGMTRVEPPDNYEGAMALQFEITQRGTTTA